MGAVASVAQAGVSHRLLADRSNELKEILSMNSKCKGRNGGVRA